MGYVVEFEQFFEEEYDGLVRSLTLAFGDRHAAEDCAQIGFERALRRWRSVRTMDRPGTWVYVVAVRHGRRALARDDRRTEIERPADPGPEDAVVDELWIAELIAMLPARQRAAVVLRHLSGLKLAEIADALGVTTGTVKASLHAAYASLRIDVGDAERDTHDSPGGTADATS